MTSSINNEADLRHWLVDYLVTNIGCTPDEVDPNLSLSDLGVGSRDAVVLSGELSELLGESVSPIDFWEHPTINALAPKHPIPMTTMFRNCYLVNFAMAPETLARVLPPVQLVEPGLADQSEHEAVWLKAKQGARQHAQ